jgi:DNA-directed RNA polymerase specialized sigma24 family protein
MTAIEVNELVENHFPLAKSIARRWGRWKPELREDILSEAVFGLFIAARTYQPERGPFARHAWYKIHWRLMRLLKREHERHPATFREQADPNPVEDLLDHRPDPRDRVDLEDSIDARGVDAASIRGLLAEQVSVHGLCGCCWPARRRLERAILMTISN